MDITDLVGGVPDEQQTLIGRKMESPLSVRQDSFQRHKKVMKEMVPGSTKTKSLTFVLVLSFPIILIIILFVLFLVVVLFFLFLYSGTTGIKIYDVAPSEYQLIIDPFRNSSDLNQWLGGDSCASAFVEFGDDDQYMVFMFGKSLIGSAGEDGTRTVISRINNSVGVYEILQEDDHIKFYWGNDESIGEAKDYYASEGNYWYHFPYGIILLDPYHVEYRNLFIFSPRVLKGEVHTGVTIIKCSFTRKTIVNPHEWLCEHDDLPDSLSSFNEYEWGTPGGILIENDLFLLGKKNGERNMFMSKIGLEALNDFDWSKFEIFTKDGWKTGSLEGESAIKPLPIEGLIQSYESNLHYSPFLEKYVIIQKKHDDEFDSYLFTSDVLTGPYSSYYLYQVPQKYQKKDVRTDAFKVHKHLPEPEEDIIFSYNIFSNQNFDTYLDEWNEFFIPQFIRAKMKKTKRRVW